MRKPSVDPAFTFGISLVVSLLLWWGTLRALLAGNVDITDAGLRYLVSLAISWCGVYFVATIIAIYASHTPTPAHEQPTPEVDRHPARRHDDEPLTEVVEMSDPAILTEPAP